MPPHEAAPVSTSRLTGTLMSSGLDPARFGGDLVTGKTPHDADSPLPETNRFTSTMDVGHTSLDGASVVSSDERREMAISSPRFTSTVGQSGEPATPLAPETESARTLGEGSIITDRDGGNEYTVVAIRDRPKGGPVAILRGPKGEVAKEVWELKRDLAKEGSSWHW